MNLWTLPLPAKSTDYRNSISETGPDSSPRALDYHCSSWDRSRQQLDGTEQTECAQANKRLLTQKEDLAEINTTTGNEWHEDCRKESGGCTQLIWRKRSMPGEKATSFAHRISSILMPIRTVRKWEWHFLSAQLNAHQSSDLIDHSIWSGCQYFAGPGLYRSSSSSAKSLHTLRSSGGKHRYSSAKRGLAHGYGISLTFRKTVAS